MERRWAHGPHLDVEAEPWLATFPGLGSVSVAENGEVRVAADPGEAEQERAAALRWGWAEPLSLARQGYLLLNGTGMVSPDGSEALLLNGDPHDSAIAMIELVHHGWSVLGDRVTPTRWDQDRLVAHPRQAPVLVSRSRTAKAQWSGVPARRDSDALVTPVPRCADPTPLTTVIHLVSAKIAEPIELTPLTGLKRFEKATSLRFSGPLGDKHAISGGEPMAGDMRLANAVSSYLLGCSGSRIHEIRRALHPLMARVAA